MHLTHRSLWMSLLCVAFLFSATACGGDDDDIPASPDAAHADAAPDAPPGTPDGAIDAATDGASDDAEADAEPGTPDAHQPDAHVPVCGDAHQDPGEACDDGNAINGDGCEVDCTLTPTAEIQCATLPPLPAGSGVCSVTAGNGAKLFQGTVLTPGRVYRGGQVAVDATGTIMCVGCDCAGSVAGATVITCPKGVISPGLINDHDHITFTQNDPYTQTAERYEQRHDWRKGQRGHHSIPSAGSANTAQLDWGELRFLMGGATSIVGSGGTAGFLRNLDLSNTLQGGLNQTPVNFETFPLDDSAGTQITGTCNYGSMADTEAVLTPVDAYLPHVSEGIDAQARNEFLCLSSAVFDTTAPGISHVLTGPKSAFIHGVGLTAADYALMASTQTGLIWSPRSNITLYGNTASVTLAHRLGVQIALGTDWMPTGSMNLLRELKCASDFNRIYLGGAFSDEDLWKMVTVNAAALSATDDVIGVLAPGKVADISIFDGSVNDSFHAVVAAQAADVTLVVRGGKVLYGDDALVDGLSATAGECDPVPVCGDTKRVCAFSEVGKHYAELVTAVGADYPTFFCGEPTNEPSCVPTRGAVVAGSSTYTGDVSAMDQDGDGILDAADDCPTVFNPVRPLDMGVQADADLDGLGDVCDPCPFDAGTTTCTVFNPDDPDGDHVLSADDNCPSIPNPGQEDADGDHKGDACDPCPSEANPGSQGCTTSIYSIKNGTTPIGTTVAIKNAIVTARFGTASSGGAWLQVKPGDPGDMGADFSGIFVFGGNTVAVGDRVDVTTATTAVFSNQIELTGAAMTVTSSGNALPDPVLVADPATIATNGSRAAKLEGVLVKVADVTVASLDAANFEFLVQGGLRVDDAIFRANPFPVVGTNYASVTGVLALRQNQSKIEIRSAADLVLGRATMTGFGPDGGSVNVGDSGVPTAPAPLTVTLAQAVPQDTFVAITSGDEAALTVVGGGVTVPAGQTSAPVLLNGVAAAASVTLTATLGTTVLTSTVRVVGVAETAKLVSLTPPMATTTPGGTVTLTVALDLPAPAGGTVVNLALEPAAAGMIPATVTVPEGQTTASFTYIDGSVGASATVTATLDAASFQAAITIVAQLGKLVINEVEYDNVMTDTGEWVEIYNGTGSDVPLAGKKLVLVNGANSGAATYDTIDLSGPGTLPAGGYLVVASTNVTNIAAGALVVRFTGTQQDRIQNGSPDGLALVDTTAGVGIDALAYEGAMPAATITGVTAPVVLTEGTFLPMTVADSNTAVGSLARSPNGTDTDNAATDWVFTATSTPGSANMP